MLYVVLKLVHPKLGVLPPGDWLLPRQHIQPLAVAPENLQPALDVSGLAGNRRLVTETLKADKTFLDGEEQYWLG